LWRESVRHMSDALVGNNPRVILYRERARMAVNHSIQNAWLRLQESLDATGTCGIKICRPEIHHTYEK
jgi:hypothetical protein